MTTYDYIDISEKHQFKYNNKWVGIKCPSKFYKTSNGYQKIMEKYNVSQIKYMLIDVPNVLKILDPILIYCDYYRYLYPQLLGISNVHSDNEQALIHALFQRGYRCINISSDKIPKTEYLFLYRDRNEILELLK